MNTFHLFQKANTGLSTALLASLIESRENVVIHPACPADESELIPE